MISSQSEFKRVMNLESLAALPGTAHLTSKEGALYINTTPEVLRVWRSQGKGPRFKGRGHFVRYLKSDLDEFMSGFDHRFDVAQPDHQRISIRSRDVKDAK
jgi:hypothetical protein